MLIMFIQLQKEDKKDKLLPYADKLDEEAFQNLREIKTHLGSALLLHEAREPLMCWIHRLDSYISLYDLRFPKEDHVLFVQIIYDILTIPDLPVNAISGVYPTFRKLIKKKKLLIPNEDLTLPWRPLYDICKKVFWSSDLKQAAYRINVETKAMLEELVSDVRYYFPPSATQDILDELRPMLCPFDEKAVRYGVQMLSRFLPLSGLPDLSDRTYKLWLDEILRLWDACANNSFSIEDSMMYLMAWLALLNVGTVDWEEYIPVMYTRFLKIFKLPVHYKKMGSLKMSKMVDDKVASWIVSTLGGGSRSQDYLEQLLKTLESYCHSANNGFWQSIIKSFLKKLSQFFRIRVKRERFKEPFWRVWTPENKKLTDNDIQRFVVSVQNITMMAMFSPTMSLDCTRVFQILAVFRPDLVIPPLLDRFYSTLDCVTEPHKYVVVLRCIRSIAKSMLTPNSEFSYPEGRKHVIPLLFAVLPGIDPNDHQKSIVTLQFITTFLTMIPVVDCSSFCSKFTDMTPDEAELADATSQFEEFILQLMDRMFLYIESVAQENVRIENHVSDERSRVEKHILFSMHVSCTTIFGQLSYPIFMEALKKMYNYSMMKIFEREVAGYAVASMIASFAKINAEETNKLFLPKLCSYLSEAVKSQDLKNEDVLDNEFLYKLLLLSEVVAGTPDALVPYIPLITDVLDETLHLKCKEGYDLSALLLSNILFTFSDTFPINCFEYNRFFDPATCDVLPLREWGRNYTWNELQLEWYTPNEKTISVAEQLFWKYLMPELETIDKYTDNEKTVSREHIRCTLTILVSLLSGEILLEKWTTEPLQKFRDYRVPFQTLELNKCITRYISMPNGSNVYKVLIEKMAAFQTKLLAQTDDTVSYLLLVKIWSHLLMYDAQRESEYHERKDLIKVYKSNYGCEVGPVYSNLRSVLIAEVAYKHIRRWLIDGVVMTEIHKIAALKLFDLATCDYLSVQVVARNVFQFVIQSFVDHSFIVEKLVENLLVDNVKHKEKFKSTITLLKSRYNRKSLTTFNFTYEFLKSILPAIVCSMPSEEPPIIKSVEELSDAIMNTNWHYSFNIKIPQSLLDKAKLMWLDSKFELLQVIPSDSEILESAGRLEEENQKVMTDYKELIGALMEPIQKKTLQWKYEIMAASFVAVLLVPDVPCHVDVVRYFLHCLVHDQILYRKMAIRCMIYIMKMSKPKKMTEKVDPLAIKQNILPVEGDESFPGHRASNHWCCYHENNIPKNERQWNEVRYSYRCFRGYYAWPRELCLPSAPNVQPINNLSETTMDETLKEINIFFSDTTNFDKFIEYSCLEEKKGEFVRGSTIVLFKYLLKIYGYRHFDAFISHLEKLMDKKEENYQRCAAEMFGGVIQGTKLWPYDEHQKFVVRFAPLLRKALDNMTLETQKNWGSSIATGLVHCDVNKCSYLFELLMEDPIKGDAAFKDCGRLYLLQSGALHSWRMSSLWCKTLEYIKPHLANEYQSLRERLGLVLVTIFETDFETSQWNRTLSPHVSDFVDYLLPKLEVLYSVAPNSHEIITPCNQGDTLDATREQDVKEAILLLKTVCKWCWNAFHRCHYPMKPVFYKFFPIFCLMENYEQDEELKKCCKQTLSVMSSTPMLLCDIPVFIDVFEKISVSNSWCAKCTGLDFLQAFAFHNIFLLSSREKWISKIVSLVLKLLEDPRCEVRQKAGEVISGFIHHNILSDSTALIGKFKKMSRTSLKHKSNINMRHAGVLGFCSFISAYPYTIPAEIPPLFSEIGVHLNDPEPIPSAIRKTLGNFKRTHHANWNELKMQFTPDQLEIFTDIIIPPNHYA